MRDTKVLETFLKNNYKKIKEMSLFRHLKKKLIQVLMELKTI
jgi:hypothetical protein